MKKILTLLVFVGLLHGCQKTPPTSQVLASGVPTGEMRSMYEYNRIINERLFENEYYLGQFYDAYDLDQDGLAALLGTFNGTGINLAYRNGQPNAMNVII